MWQQAKVLRTSNRHALPSLQRYAESSDASQDLVCIVLPRLTSELKDFLVCPRRDYKGRVFYFAMYGSMVL